MCGTRSACCVSSTDAAGHAGIGAGSVARAGAGFTLIELMWAMTLSLVVMAAVASLFGVFTRSLTAAQAAAGSRRAKSVSAVDVSAGHLQTAHQRAIAIAFSCARSTRSRSVMGSSASTTTRACTVRRRAAARSTRCSRWTATRTRAL